MCPIYYISPGHPNGRLGATGNHSCIYTAWLAVQRRYGGRTVGSVHQEMADADTLPPARTRYNSDAAAYSDAHKSQLSPRTTAGAADPRRHGRLLQERRIIWLSNPTLPRLTPRHFSSSSSLRQRKYHPFADPVSLQNAWRTRAVPSLWAMAHNRETGVSDRQFTMATHTIPMMETTGHALDNPTSTSSQRSNVIGVCIGLLFSPCPSQHPHTQTARLNPQQKHNAKQIEYQHDPPAATARRKLHPNPAWNTTP